MAESLLSLLNAIRSSSEEEQKRDLSLKVEEILENDSRYIQGMFFSVFNRVIISNRVPELEELSKGEFFTTRVTTYVDDDNRTRVAIGITYLQDFRFPDDTLDDRVLDAVVEAIKKDNLDLVFNDVCVNLLQSRNGERVVYA